MTALKDIFFFRIHEDLKGYLLRVVLQRIAVNLIFAEGPLQLTAIVSQIQQMRWPFLRPLAPFYTCHVLLIQGPFRESQSKQPSCCVSWQRMSLVH
jgi:hypothetical protein